MALGSIVKGFKLPDFTVPKAIEELPEKFKEAEISDDNLHEFITETMNKMAEQIKEIKEEMDELCDEIETTLGEMNKKIEETLNNPVQVDLKPSNVKGERVKKEEKEEVNPRKHIFNKLLTNL
jgi:glutamyl-tRNA reductase